MFLYKYCSIVAGTNGINFLDYGRCYWWNRFRPSNWVKVVDENGNPVRNENGDVVLEEAYL
jgi:aconitate hydratase 2/2-methylisocitrate dehydratase